MGGGTYSFDVAEAARSSTNRSGGNPFDYRGYANDAAAASGRHGVHPLLDIHGQERVCMNDQAVVVAMDVTRSRGDDAQVVYEKLPTLIGWLEMQGYLPGAAISFAAIGDATVDQAPLQVSQWERDNRLDEALSKCWLERGGGGSGEESYELAAYFYAYHTHLKVTREGRKGYFFFVGDEGFYPTVDSEQVRRVLGQSIAKPVASDLAFRKLQERFHVFFVYPQKSWRDRQADIDAEIAQRVRQAGGQYDDVDVRVSLLWNTRDDLDLHVVTPSGEEIYYGHKLSRCGGALDVDRNVRGEDPKPVENIRWPRGQAPAGQYRVYVQNYSFHEPGPAPIDLRLEVDVDGDIRHYTQWISPKLQTGTVSNVEVCQFVFAPGTEAAGPAAPDAYANYDDAVIRKQWAGVIAPDHILPLEDPGEIIEVMVGAIGLTEGRTNLDGYLDALDRAGPRGKAGPGHRLRATRRACTSRDQVSRALANLSLAGVPTATLSLEASRPHPGDPGHPSSLRRL